MVNELKGGCWLGLECSIVAAERHITEVEIEVDIRDGPVTGSYWRRGRWERGRGGRETRGEGGRAGIVRGHESRLQRGFERLPAGREHAVSERFEDPSCHTRALGGPLEEVVCLPKAYGLHKPHRGCHHFRDPIGFETDCPFDMMESEFARPHGPVG